jgi:hypothetical protein
MLRCCSPRCVFTVVMLILENRKFIQAAFRSESELESVVIDNAESIFGPSSIYFPRLLFRTGDGARTIPDGFVIDPSTRQWYLVEAELARHGVWNHIAPQVAKQIIAASQPLSKQLLIELAVEKIREDQQLREKFTDLGIEVIDIRRVLAEILDKKPIIGMPIDAVSRDLQEWATTLRNEVKLWIVKKFVEFGQPGNVLYEVPEEYRPVLDTQDGASPATNMARYQVELCDLMEAGLITPGELLYMTYGPKNTERKTYTGTLQDDGSIEVLGNYFTSPSYAALYVVQDAGSNRRAVYGWTMWKTINGESLADLREQYLQQRPVLPEDNQRSMAEVGRNGAAHD